MKLGIKTTFNSKGLVVAQMQMEDIQLTSSIASIWRLSAGTE